MIIQFLLHLAKIPFLTVSLLIHSYQQIIVDQISIRLIIISSEAVEKYPV